MDFLPLLFLTFFNGKGILGGLRRESLSVAAGISIPRRGMCKPRRQMYIPRRGMWKPRRGMQFFSAFRRKIFRPRASSPARGRKICRGLLQRLSHVALFQPVALHGVFVFQPPGDEDGHEAEEGEDGTIRRRKRSKSETANTHSTR